MGFRPVLITARPDKYPYLSYDGAPEAIVVPQVDEDDLYRLIRERFARRGELAGITSSSEYFIAIAAGLAARFDLPGPDAARIQFARDKSWQREALAAGGLQTPVFRVVASAAEAMTAAREIGFPVVVKPVDGSGSIGVRECANSLEAGEHALVLLSQAPAGRETRRLLVESRIVGPEFSVEVFSGRVVGITLKHLGNQPYFVETGHDYPAPVSVDVAHMLEQTVCVATELLGLGWGPLHWEVRMRGGQAVLIEVNPRLAGGFIPELVRHAQGIDLIRETLRLVVGGVPELDPSRRRYASIRFLVAPGPGLIAAVQGIRGARAADSVVDVALYRSLAEELTIRGDFRDRVGHVMTCADDYDAAHSAAERAHDMIRIQIVATAEDRRNVGAAACRPT